MASSYTSNRAGWRRLMRGAGVKSARDASAERVAGNAQAIAPVLTGAYRASIHVESGDDDSRVIADVPYAAVIEGRENVLGRALHP